MALIHNRGLWAKKASTNVQKSLTRAIESTLGIFAELGNSGLRYIEVRTLWKFFPKTINAQRMIKNILYYTDDEYISGRTTKYRSR